MAAIEWLSVSNSWLLVQSLAMAMGCSVITFMCLATNAGSSR